MKKIDRLLLISFIPPFIVTFGIATFVLVMQILWVYIDDIAGKGLGILLVFELLAYKSVGLAPMALPMAILLSSVMVVGGLAERYELSSFKSAGVSLLRVMRPLILFGAATMLVSYYCSNNLIPVANLKFGSRMHDIQRKKPSLSLDAGVFNDDFTDYAIYIGSKSRDGSQIRDIIIYDHRDAAAGKLTEIVAKTGRMYSSADGRYFIMQLQDGHQYTETGPAGRRADGSHPFVRVGFQSWTKVFDLGEFDLARTNEDLFTSNRAMMGSAQLRVAIDSIEQQVGEQVASMNNFLASFISLVRVDTSVLAPDNHSWINPAVLEQAIAVETQKLTDSLQRTATASPAAEQTAVVEGPSPNANAIRSDSFYIGLYKARKQKGLAVNKVQPKKLLPPDSLQRLRNPVEIFPPDISFTAWIDQLPIELKNRIYTKARSSVRSIETQAEMADRTLDVTRENLAKFVYELHTKYSLAVVCIIFVFVGAPMGAIVRKGGFGYPILVSIIFFILFIVLTIFCRKIAETFIVPAVVAAWIPCLVLLPVGLWLTTKAMNDSPLKWGLIDQLRGKIALYREAKKNQNAETPTSAAV
jgi:lipopolysaccharide export system permease protein